MPDLILVAADRGHMNLKCLIRSRDADEGRLQVWLLPGDLIELAGDDAARVRRRIAELAAEQERINVTTQDRVKESEPSSPPGNS